MDAFVNNFSFYVHMSINSMTFLTLPVTYVSSLMLTVRMNLFQFLYFWGMNFLFLSFDDIIVNITYF